jgi:hypothetical protein
MALLGPKRALTKVAAVPAHRGLSKLEELPTELLQYIASYLIRKDFKVEVIELNIDAPDRFEPDGTCQWRAASKTL